MNKTILVAIPIIVGIGIGIFLVGLNDQINPTSFNSIQITAKNLKTGGSPDGGEPSAPITIVEYGDYQCTFCYRFHQTTLKTLESEYIDTGKINLIFKDFPLNGADSVLAAEASHCAGDQGKYWQYHDELYDNWGGERTGWITRDALTGFAISIGISSDEFNRCLDDKKYNQIIHDMYGIGQKIGIDATPSFLIFNDKEVVKIVGNQPLEVFIKTIEMLQSDQT